MLVHRTILTPLGAMRLVATPVALVEAEFTSEASGGHARSDVLDGAERELRSYFAGKLRSFCTPLSFAGTDFQRAVWRALMRIPHGQRVSYRTLAERVGRPRAVRAVGSANGKNRLAIFVPCHRVIASSGELAGYAGGVDKKRWLLDHEIEPSVGRGPTGSMTLTTGPEPD